MGIRTLHRHSAPAQATTGETTPPEPSPVPPFAPTAGTPHIPTPPATSLRNRATPLRQALTARTWHRCAEQARDYLALLLTAVPRSRPVRTATVFITTAGGSAQAQHRTPEPDATP
ncbi:hypothetical protein [Streptomyces sp. S.PB5]|uniref:hypothetical protein n=1 Tax=Streptomyces sp. S.PB5 TaxID=3020844 RepID=UPI0025B03733|nr:hypothetical protein [Streptomyces sp. S.PB5]MDN3020953.1 hypothetical protein [Streptomyces sp. S.PB5]